MESLKEILIEKAKKFPELIKKISITKITLPNNLGDGYETHDQYEFEFFPRDLAPRDGIEVKR